MALNATVQGATLPVEAITWQREDGTAQNLSGATITGRIFDIMRREARAITGSLVITNATTGAFTWTRSTADVASEGVFEVQFKATYAGGISLTFTTYWRVGIAV